MGHPHRTRSLHLGRVADMDVLTEVGEGDNVSRLIVIATAIGHPYLYLGDLGTRRYEGQLGHGLVVAVTEEMTQEEVAVLVIVVDVDLEVRRLYAPLRGDGTRLGVLLGQEGVDAQFAKL